MTEVSTALEVYSLEEILELNDITAEEVLIYLVEERVIKLPDIHALEYD